MKKRFNKIIIFSFAICLLAFLTIGCASRRNVQQPNQDNLMGQRRGFMDRNNNQGTNISPNTGNDLGINNNTLTRYDNARVNEPGIDTRRINDQRNSATNDTGLLNNNADNLTGQTGFDRQRADNIRNQLANTIGEAPDNVIVNGNTCVIGYRPTTGRERNDTKNKIINKVKEIDPKITKVIVSDTDDMNSRINQLTNDIRNGIDNNTNNNIMNDLNNRFNRLIQDITNNSR